MQVRITRLFQDGRPIPKEKQIPLEGGLQRVWSGITSYLAITNFYGGFEMTPPGRLWEPVFVKLQDNTFVFRGTEVGQEGIRYGQMWAVDIGAGYMTAAPDPHSAIAPRRPVKA